MGRKVSLKIVLTPGSPLLPALFPIYINDIQQNCRRETEGTVIEDHIGNAQITMTADDVAKHRKLVCSGLMHAPWTKQIEEDITDWFGRWYRSPLIISQTPIKANWPPRNVD